MFKPTAVQVNLMKHALGLGRGSGEYRNHYVSGIGCSSLADLEILEREGLVHRIRTPQWMEDNDIVFMVTNEGKAFCKGVR